MREDAAILDEMMALLHERYGGELERYLVPPPVFLAMQGSFIRFDAVAAELSARFPILERWLNPYGLMQGGMVAAAMDNTLGPLSMLIAPANVTRRMEIKYSKGTRPAMEHLVVEASLLERDGRWLTLQALARSPDGELLARATARHYILPGEVSVGGGEEGLV